MWVIKSRTQLSWFEAQLQSVLADVDECRRAQPDLSREIEMSIYVTCDEELESPAANKTLCAQSQTTTPATVVEIQDEKSATMQKDNGVTVEPVSPVSLSSGRSGGCLPSGGCCCTNRVEDEDEDGITEVRQCTCSGNAPTSTSLEESQIPNDEKEPRSTTVTLPTQSTINHLSGRPHPQTIIRKVLEKAEGESAVVVCGPAGLSADVRRSVVSLSDERAVHKGTGAQGIYLHVEQFGW